MLPCASDDEASLPSKERMMAYDMTIEVKEVK